MVRPHEIGTCSTVDRRVIQRHKDAPHRRRWTPMKPGPGIVTVTDLTVRLRTTETGGITLAPDPHSRHRFPAEIISHAVRLYHVLRVSLRDVELLLADRGVVVSYERLGGGAGSLASPLQMASAVADHDPRTRGTPRACSSFPD
jgi:hypothetical protein